MVKHSIFTYADSNKIMVQFFGEVLYISPVTIWDCVQMYKFRKK